MHRLLILYAFLGFSFVFAQSPTLLTASQIHAAEMVGKRTKLPLTIGTLVNAEKGDDFQAFVLLPQQRIAYVVSDAKYSNRSYLITDDLKHNELRVYGLIYKSKDSRRIRIYDLQRKTSLLPIRISTEVHQPVADFDFQKLKALSQPNGEFYLVIDDDLGPRPAIRLNLANLKKK